MTKLRIAFLILGAALATTPSFAVSKEILQLQTQMQVMQDQMTSMQRSFDERMGVMRNLVEQNTDTMNKIAGSIDKLQTSIQKQNTDRAGNASFYLAEIEFKAGSYAQAAKDYDKVLENFPSGNKVAAAHLKKGYSFAELGQKDAAIAELQTLIQDR